MCKINVPNRRHSRAHNCSFTRISRPETIRRPLPARVRRAYIIAGARGVYALRFAHTHTHTQTKMKSMPLGDHHHGLGRIAAAVAATATPPLSSIRASVVRLALWVALKFACTLSAQAAIHPRGCCVCLSDGYIYVCLMMARGLRMFREYAVMGSTSGTKHHSATAHTYIYIYKRSVRAPAIPNLGAFQCVCVCAYIYSHRRARIEYSRAAATRVSRGERRLNSSARGGRPTSRICLSVYLLGYTFVYVNLHIYICECVNN